MGKKKIIIAFILFFSICFSIRGFQIWKHHQEWVEHLYQDETFAFGMSMATSYRDYSYVNESRLVIILGSYNHLHPEVNLSLDEIKDFLSKEYDEKGKPRVLNPPERLSNYIHWFWYEGGDSYSMKYNLGLDCYKKEHTEKYGTQWVVDLDIDSLKKIISEFNSCANAEDYIH